MTENTQNNTESGVDAANNGSTTTTTEGRATKTLFPTLEAAQAAKPESEKQRVFEVLKDGRVLGYGWGNSVNEALVTAARQDGYTARVVQHEVDHLDGIEFLDRMRSMTTITTVQNYLAFHRHQAR